MGVQPENTKVPDEIRLEEEEYQRVTVIPPWSQLVFLIGLVMTISHLIWLTIYPVDEMLFRALHLAFASVLIFLIRPSGSRKDRPSWLDLALALLSMSVVIYVNIDLEALAFRMGVNPTRWDIVFGVILIVLLLELSRRMMGWFLVIVVLCFIAYALFGADLPDPLGHRGYSLERVVSVLFGVQGIYGMPMHVSAAYAFIFILFGALLDASGTGRIFIDLALSATGQFRGGPAKVSVVSSALFGMISGSAVSNVTVDGIVTIPMMKKYGFKKEYAGAIEAVTSTGGQIMPPVMGSAAFLMAEFTGIPYAKIIIAAAIPAILYYLAVYFMIDFESISLGLLGVPRKYLPKFWKTIRNGFHMLLPIVVLVYMLVGLMTSPAMSAAGAMAAVVVCGWFRRTTRMMPRAIGESLSKGARGVLEVAVTCGMAGIIIGILTLTGLGLKFTGLLLTLAGSNLPALLVLTAIVCLILGMGMPTPAAYIITAAVATPAIIKLGVSVMAAHLFVVYFAIISTITPPVALAAYAAAGLAKADPMKVGWIAVRLGIAAFIVPFMFVYAPELLMMGDWKWILWCFVTATIGCYALARAVQYRSAPILERVLLFVASLLLIIPGLVTDVIGFALMIVALAVRRFVYGIKGHRAVRLAGDRKPTSKG